MTIPVRGPLLLLLAGCASSAPASSAPATPEPIAPERRAAAVGQKAPPVDLSTIDGKRARIVAGKVNVVFFWATWSEPDKKSFPPYQRLWEKHRDEGLTLLGISVDEEPSGIAEFARTVGASFPVAWDAGHFFSERYAPATEPTSYVIDRKGFVRFVNNGWHDGEITSIEAQVEQLLREP